MKGINSMNKAAEENNMWRWNQAWPVDLDPLTEGVNWHLVNSDSKHWQDEGAKQKFLYCIWYM